MYVCTFMIDKKMYIKYKKNIILPFISYSINSTYFFNHFSSSAIVIYLIFDILFSDICGG